MFFKILNQLLGIFHFLFKNFIEIFISKNRAPKGSKITRSNFFSIIEKHFDKSLSIVSLI